MDLQDKLEIFSKLTMKEAEDYKLDIMNEITEKYRNECNRFTQEEEKKAQAILHQEKLKAEEMMNAQILQSSVTAKRSLVDLRSSLIDDIFKDVMEKITHYIETPEYQNKLIEDIKALSKEYNCAITVSLCARDLMLEEKISQIPHVTVVQDQGNFIGGYQALIKSKNIIINQTYRDKLEHIKSNFVGFKIT